MEKGKLIYTGKAKDVYETTDKNLCIIKYRDDATAGNGQKKGSFLGKGIINNKISNELFKILASKGIPIHLVDELNDREILAKKVDIIPLEVIIRNVAAGSFSKNYGVPEGTKLKCEIMEFSYKNDDLGDPLINDYHAIALGIVTIDEINEIKELAFNVNKVLQEIFINIGIILVDFKIEVGKDSFGKIILADEISPDTCRLWDKNTMKKLDKDQFRRDLGEFSEVYEEVFNRLLGK